MPHGHGHIEEVVCCVYGHISVLYKGDVAKLVLSLNIVFVMKLGVFATSLQPKAPFSMICLYVIRRCLPAFISCNFK